MLGAAHKAASANDLSVFVQVVDNEELFERAKRLWDQNGRLRYKDSQHGKEVIRFTYARPACTAWLQRDEARSDMFELVLFWQESATHEVFVVGHVGGTSTGGDSRLRALLDAMLVTPSVVPMSEANQ